MKIFQYIFINFQYFSVIVFTPSDSDLYHCSEIKKNRYPIITLIEYLFEFMKKSWSQPALIYYRVFSMISLNESAFNEAPPIKAPSISSIAIYSAMFSGFTDPPY